LAWDPSGSALRMTKGGSVILSASEESLDCLAWDPSLRSG